MGAEPKTAHPRVNFFRKEKTRRHMQFALNKYSLASGLSYRRIRRASRIPVAYIQGVKYEIATKDQDLEEIYKMLNCALTRYPGYIVGGSISLFLRGYIDRLPEDVDLICKEIPNIPEAEDIGSGDSGIQAVVGGVKIDFLLGTTMRYEDWTLQDLSFKLGYAEDALVARLNYGGAHKRSKETLDIIKQNFNIKLEKK